MEGYRKRFQELVRQMFQFDYANLMFSEVRA